MDLYDIIVWQQQLVYPLSSDELEDIWNQTVVDPLASLPPDFVHRLKKSFFQAILYRNTETVKRNLNKISEEFVPETDHDVQSIENLSEFVETSTNNAIELLIQYTKNLSMDIDLERYIEKLLIGISDYCTQNYYPLFKEFEGLLEEESSKFLTESELIFKEKRSPKAIHQALESTLSSFGDRIAERTSTQFNTKLPLCLSHIYTQEIKHIILEKYKNSYLEHLQNLKNEFRRQNEIVNSNREDFRFFDNEILSFDIRYNLAGLIMLSASDSQEILETVLGLLNLSIENLQELMTEQLQANSQVDLADKYSEQWLILTDITTQAFSILSFISVLKENYNGCKREWITSFIRLAFQYKFVDLLIPNRQISEISLFMMLEEKEFEILPIGLCINNQKSIHQTIVVTGGILDKEIKMNWEELASYEFQRLTFLYRASDSCEIFEPFDDLREELDYLNAVSLDEIYTNMDRKGKELADLILKNNLCTSLVGFSTGASAVLSCLKYLKGSKLVHGIFLIGGIVPSQKSVWNDYYEETKGKFVNVYSKQDSTLCVLASRFHKLTGMSELALPKVHNLDVSDLIDSQFRYPEHLETILSRLKYNL